MMCKFCSKLDSDCECTFHCSECDSVMVKDEINGGHLCPICDDWLDNPEWAGNVLEGSDEERAAWAAETFHVKKEQA